MANKKRKRHRPAAKAASAQTVHQPQALAAHDAHSAEAAPLQTEPVGLIGEGRPDSAHPCAQEGLQNGALPPAATVPQPPHSAQAKDAQMTCSAQAAAVQAPTSKQTVPAPLADAQTMPLALPDISLPDPASAPEEAAEHKRPWAKKARKGKRCSLFRGFLLFSLAVTVVSVALVVLLFQVAGASLLGIRPDVELPNFQNMRREDIEGNSQYAKFRIVFKEEYNADVEEGVVFDQSPKAPKQVKENARITLVVSKGVQYVTVPNVDGWEKSTAREKLRDVGLTLLIKQEESETVATGCVVRTVPAAGMEVEAGTTVTVYVSRPVEEATAYVPNCVGLTESEATQKLSALRLSPNVVLVDNTQAQGTVLGQSPKAGTLLGKGESVTLQVSSGQLSDVDPSGHVHEWAPVDENGWRVCYVCLERQQVR